MTTPISPWVLYNVKGRQMYTTSIEGLFRYKCSQCLLVPYHNYPRLYSHLRRAARLAVEPASSGAGLSCVYHRTTRKRAEQSENFRKPLFYSAEVANILFNHASCRALLALPSSLQREMVRPRVIPQCGFLSFSCWDVSKVITLGLLASNNL